MLHRIIGPVKNKYFFSAISIILVLIILFNLFQIQIVKGEKFFYDAKNALSYEFTVPALRGTIYDRNGVKLVDNLLRYDVYVPKVNPEDENLKETIDNLELLFGQELNTKYLTEYEKIKDISYANEIRLFEALEYNPYIFKLEANENKYPLLNIKQVIVRKYLFTELTSHIIGYVGEITAEDYQTGKYKFGDRIGKFGIEKTYDDFLRGKDGIQKVDFYRSDQSRITTVLEPKENGKDVYLTIDIAYQQRLYDAVKQSLELPDLQDARSVGVVVEDIKTGEILAMASYPTFDANLFVDGITDEEYEVYLNDPGKPLLNKAIQYAQPPGSVFKTLVDIVALENGAIDENTIFEANGTFEYKGTIFQDINQVSWGDLNMEKGLCVSSNIFHMKTALALDEKTGGKGADIISRRFNELGLNVVSGINIGSEGVGYFPTPEDLERQGRLWLPGYLLNASIGQGEVKLTPIGMVKLSSFIASKGVVSEQSIVLDESRGEPVLKQKQINIETRHFSLVNEAMKCAAGNDNRYLKYDIAQYPEISQKTGTAETGQIIDDNPVIHAWEMTYAPADNPEIAVAVFVENGGYGFHAGWISRNFYKTWSQELRGR